MRKALFGAQVPAQAKLAKTVFEGAMYERLPRQGRMVALPRPFVYTLSPAQAREKFRRRPFQDCRNGLLSLMLETTRRCVTMT